MENIYILPDGVITVQQVFKFENFAIRSSQLQGFCTAVLKYFIFTLDNICHKQLTTSQDISWQLLINAHSLIFICGCYLIQDTNGTK